MAASSSMVLRRRSSRRQRECFAFDADEHPTERADAAIEIGGFGALQIGEEAADPGREMLVEQFAIGAGRRRKLSADDAGHDLAQDRRMVLRLAVAVGARDAEPAQILAQPRERPFLQEAGEIIGAIGQQLAAPDADEQVEELAL